MMRKKKAFQLTTATMFAVGSIVCVAPSESHANSIFTDVSKIATYYDDLVNLVNQGVISGFADRTFKPELTVTRGHFVQMLTTVLNLDTNQVYDPYFLDVAPSNIYYKSIAALANTGIDLTDGNRNFRPNDPITRYEVADILQQVLNIQPTNDLKGYMDVEASYQDAVSAAVQTGLMNGRTYYSFKGSDALTRAEAVTALAGVQSFTRNEIVFTYEELRAESIIAGDNRRYTFGAETANIFSSLNDNALEDAQIRAVVVNGHITKVTGITFNSSGTVRNELKFNALGSTIHGDVKVNGDYIGLNNVTIAGQMTVTKNAKRALMLEKVTVAKELFIEEVSTPEFKLAAENSSLNKVYINRNHTILNANEWISELIIQPEVDDINLNAKAKKVQVVGKSYPTIRGYISVNELTLERDADLDLKVKGTIGTIRVEHADSNIYLSREMRISKIIIPRGSYYTSIIEDYDYGYIKEYVSSIVQEGTASNLLYYE